ncbi:ABC transporter ATP-binding protein [Thauera linaloolentis]|uniref:ABC transporter n=1 Tax=Thauera linaloolentis (strain DSM 12138 / JCM 21573 / CCUG 41526 / CIP 105981 / IAM 15112 / NBRC 102519 / 47Lol) TaxID=1123367 RepID=N6Z3C1_THAL4|nr:ABC transporter ATP-binding protein [Thauera linaloolentis]ENO89107.1 ABC transporter [Thauera linaloolentis 47Lol = DSM 12138]MCM8565746.1 ABC transporter ATP-binding protein [Thauera linaloolentis]
MADTSPAPNEAARTVIVARGVRKHYGSIHAVDGVDLDVREGELFGLIGHNGAGKSTLFKMMLGLIPLSAGEIRIDGAPVGGAGGDFRAVRRKIGYLPENVVLYDNLTGLETLQFFARLKGVPPQGNAALLERVGLAHAARRRVREYSKGMRQRLGFAQALLGTPRILFLDEPTTGLDPEAIRGFYAILRQLKGEGVTMVITSHILAEIQERVDRLAIMAAGKVQATGTVQALREQMDLPLWFSVRVAAEDFEAVRAALGSLPVGAIEAREDHVAVQCPREAKMAVIAALAALGGKVRDLSVREPSLEDVFFGFSD